MTKILSLSAFVSMAWFSCMFFKACLHLSERLFCVVFSFWLIFQSFLKNVLNSLFLS